MENPIEVQISVVDHSGHQIEQNVVSHEVAESDFYAQKNEVDEAEEAHHIPPLIQEAQPQIVTVAVGGSIDLDEPDPFGFSAPIHEEEADPAMIQDEHADNALHEGTVQVSTIFPCAECTMAFDDGASLAQHQEEHEETKKPFACATCGKRFTQQSNLSSHERRHTGEKPFKCQFCAKVFMKASNLQTHEARHTGQGGYRCDICGNGYTFKFELQKHMRRHPGAAPDRPYKCQHCDKSFARTSSRTAHMVIHTGERLHHCKICKKAFKYLTELHSHRAAHPTTPKSRDCAECGKSFHSVTVLRLHLRSVHGENKPATPLTCPICFKTFKVRSSLWQHKKTHQATYSFECEVEDCGRKFKTKYQLRSHMAVHKEEKDHRCGECGKLFARRTNLLAHMSLHGPQEDKPYKCQVCEKGCSYLSELRVHERTHTGDKPFKCEVCDKGFSQRGNLNQHEKDHRCGECGKLFARRTNLLAHMSLHGPQEDKPYKCQVCEKGCSYLSELCVHERTHTGDKPFKCEVCDKGFSQRGNLNQHELMAHSDTKTQKCGVDGCMRAYKYQNDLLKHQRLKHFLLRNENDDSSDPTVEGVVIKEEKRDKYKCNSCSKEFVSAIRYKKHECTPKVKPFACSKCGEKFEKGFQLQKHKRHHVIISFKCEMCDVEFVTELLLDAHKETHRKELTCTLCKESFTQESSYKTHLKTHLSQPKDGKNASNIDGAQECSVCAEVFTSVPNLKMHEARVHGLSPFRCKLCVEGFQRASQLKQHEEVHLKKSAHRCHNCQKRFLTKEDLTQHVVDHAKDIYRCERCGDFFKFRKQLADHECEAAGTLSFTCSLCEAVFATVVELEDHMSAHASNETFECSQCMREFLELQALREHEETKHKDLDAFPCDFCELRFSTSEDQASHSEIHRTLKCQYCDEFFRSSDELEEHENEHILSDLKSHRKVRSKKSGVSEEKGKIDDHNFVCDICNKAFTQQGNMERHQRNMHGAEPNREDGRRNGNNRKSKPEDEECFVCNVCNKSFTQIGNMERHQRNIRGIEPKQEQTKRSHGNTRTATKRAKEASNNVDGSIKTDSKVTAKSDSDTNSAPTRRSRRGNTEKVTNHNVDDSLSRLKSRKAAESQTRGKAKNHNDSPSQLKTRKAAELQTRGKAKEQSNKVEVTSAKKLPFKCRHCESRFGSASKKIHHEQTH